MEKSPRVRPFHSPFLMRFKQPKHKSRQSSQALVRTLLCTSLLGALPVSSFAADDGSQMNNPFRVNYAGYMPQAAKTGLYLSDNQGAIDWSLVGTSCSGTEDTYISNDRSSGDSFYIIDFSACTDTGQGVRLAVNGNQSAPFDISPDPYGNLKYEFFDYFKDHEASATFSNAKNNWATNLSISFSYVKDAGDNGAYPTNTAEASWALINMLETYPSINTYYSDNFAGAKTVYDQLLVLTDQFKHVMNNPRKLAIPKFHTNVNDSWASCSPHTSGTCISEPETKATFATARTMAAMARLHQIHATLAEANAAYNLAKTALANARTQPFTCNQQSAFGGEGGMYPDNDNFGLWRDPKVNRDNCVADPNNTQDDEYVALVELYIAAEKLGHTADASAFKAEVVNNERFDEASSFWWGAVVMEGGLSLLANEDHISIDLTNLKSNIVAKANDIAQHQEKGYPGVTWDAHSTQWNNGDKDHIDNNVRWGSHRNALNDARIMMAAAEIEKERSNNSQAAYFARGAVKVLDHISGINAVNLAMYTASGYNHIENAITRTHDGANPGDSWAGKMVLGPNNWTNANDNSMPPFGSQPGLKMFSLTGTGWSSREVSIDANASLVPVAYFATEIAPSIMLLDPIGGTPATRMPAAPSGATANTVSAYAIELSWQDNAGSNDDAEQGFNVYRSTVNTKPNLPIHTVAANSTMWMSEGLNPETTYFYWVEAFNSVGTSGHAVASAITPAAPAAVNMLTNGDFESGSTGWECTLPQGDASCTVVDGMYHVAISNGGSAAWHVQPLQSNLSLTSGTTYTFAFDARAASNRNTEVKVERDGSPWDDFSQTGSGQSLTTNMQRFSYTFTMNTSLSNARVVMNVGNSNADVFIDNIWLVEGANDPCNGTVGCTPAITHDISVSAGANGFISPGSVSVSDGGEQTFTITPAQGFQVQDVVKNGISIGAVSSVTFTNVGADQSLSATFVKKVILDADDDGVEDGQDQCPNTPTGSPVNSVGCPDSDADGVFDNLDQCANTPENTPVDSDGCTLQSGEDLHIEAEAYTRFFDTTLGNEGGALRQDDVDIEATSDEGLGHNVGWTAAGEWLEYDIELAPGSYTVQARVAGEIGGSFGITVGSANTLNGTAPNTEGWQSWRTVELGQVVLNSVSDTLVLDMNSGGFNINWIKLIAACTNEPRCTDSDSDGVMDDADQCANTPIGTPVDEQGCPLPIVLTPIEVENYDRAFDLTVGNEGGAHRSGNVDIEVASEGGFNVGWTDAGEWLEFNRSIPAGSYEVYARVAAEVGGMLGVTLGEGNSSEESVSTFIPNTNGWQNWQTVLVGELTIINAVSSVRVDMIDGGYNINWIDIREKCLGDPNCVHDGDNDGVDDSLDRCPNTPPGKVVDAEGCEIITAGITAQQAAAEMGKGFNLGQMFESDQQPRTFEAARAKIDAYYAEGFRNVRIPITWTGEIGGSMLVNDANVGDVNRSHPRLKVIEEVVDYALSLPDMYVIINAHHEGGIKDGAKHAVLERLWQDVADIFQKRDHRLLFEILNEPHKRDESPMAPADLRNMTGKAYNKIRAVDSKRIIIIGGNQWFAAHEMAETWPHLGDVGNGQDAYVMATFHHYNPWSFNGDNQGDYSDRWTDFDMFNPMDIMTNWANTVGNGMPVYIGEWGTGWGSRYSTMQCNNIRLWYQKFDSQYASNKGQPTAVWDDGGWFKVFDHGTGTFDNNLYQCISGDCDWSGTFTRFDGCQ